MKRGVKSKSKAKPEPIGGKEIALYSKQITFTNSSRIYRGFVSGVGAGKSFVGAFDLLKRAEPGALYCIVAPTFRVLSDATLRSFVEIATTFGLWDESKYRKTDNQAILTNGVEILFRSGDEPGKLRGPTLHGCWLDECSQMKEDVFGVMIGRLRGGGKQGWLSGTFTPAGKEHWTFRVFGDVTNPNVTLVQASTKDNPFITPEFYDNLLLQYGRGEGGRLRALQELEGQFVCVEGAEWGPECFDARQWFDEWPTTDNCIKVVTLDSSKGTGGKTGDYSCFAKVMYANGQLWVAFDLNNQRNVSQMALDGIQIQRDFQPDYFGLEAEFGGHVMCDDLLMRADAANVLMPIVMIPTGGVAKDVRIRKLTPYLTQRMIHFHNDSDTKLAVGQFESWPHSVHDDSPDSLEMAIRTINESGLV